MRAAESVVSEALREPSADELQLFGRVRDRLFEEEVLPGDHALGELKKV